MSDRQIQRHNGNNGGGGGVLRAIQKALYDRYGIVLNEADQQNDEGRRRCLQLATDQYTTILRLKRSLERSQSQLHTQMRAFEQQRSQINDHRENYLAKLERLRNVNTEKAVEVKAQLDQALRVDIPGILRAIDEKIASYRRKVNDMAHRYELVSEELKDVEGLFRQMKADPPDVEMGVFGDSDDDEGIDFDNEDGLEGGVGMSEVPLMGAGGENSAHGPPALIRAQGGGDDTTTVSDDLTEGAEATKRLI